VQDHVLGETRGDLVQVVVLDRAAKRFLAHDCSASLTYLI